MTTVNLSGKMPETPTGTSMHTRLSAAWVWPVRLVWIAVTLISIGLYIAAIPARLDQIRTLCIEPPCQPGQITQEGAAARDGKSAR